MKVLGEHAVVLGASIAGLLTARVLADHYTRVTVVERDVLTDSEDNRRGVPQGRHLHGLTLRGTHVLEELFPGLLDDLVTSGACLSDDGDISRFHVCVNGHLLVRSGRAEQTGALGLSRPFLECHVRRRVRAIPNVHVLDGHDVVGVTSTPTRDRITGARVVSHSSGVERALSADLVVDATGRGARTSTFLEALGYQRPPEDRVTVHLKYSSQALLISPDALRELLFLVTPVPGRPTAVALARGERDTWILTAAGWAGHEPPDGDGGILDFVATMLPGYALEALRTAIPLGPTAQHRYPASRWHRYDRVRRHPDGLIALGDAVCSFNPAYGQGMTVAALQVLALRECLSRGTTDLPKRFYRKGAKPIRQAWDQVVGNDLALPEVEGSRPLAMRLAAAYTERVLTAAEYDAVAMEAFMRVVWLMDPPSRLLRPGILARAIGAQRLAPAVDARPSRVVSRTRR